MTEREKIEEKIADLKKQINQTTRMSKRNQAPRMRREINELEKQLDNLDESNESTDVQGVEEESEVKQEEVEVEEPQEEEEETKEGGESEETNESEEEPADNKTSSDFTLDELEEEIKDMSDEQIVAFTKDDSRKGAKEINKEASERLQS